MSRISFSRKYLSIPYAIFLILFVIIPMLLIIFYAFTDSDNNFTFNNITKYVSNIDNLNTFLVSVLIGLANTLLCLLIGYPIAYILAKKERNGQVIVLFFIMPMWINFVLRTAAMRDLLYWIGLDGGTYPYLATMLGMIYNYLPFVVLPLYTTMIKMDKSQIEAAMDLGATPRQTFVKTIIPMTLPGIISASTMVFMPTMSSFVISDVMSERNIVLIGNSIQQYFNQGLWHMGSLVALIMLIILGISSLLSKNGEKEVVRGSAW